MKSKKLKRNKDIEATAWLSVASAEPGQITESSVKTFVTIDDALARAHDLLSCLKTLSTYKHPLEVRRGKGVIDMAAKEREESRQIRAGSRTYFVDLEHTKEGKRYLRITESRFKGEDQERERQSLVVFPEDAEEFAQAIGELAALLAEEKGE